MPKLAGIALSELNQTMSGFDYTSMAVEKLGASEYTLVGIVCDKTGSVSSFKKQLEDMITASLGSCKKAPRALNLIARTTAFNSVMSKVDIEEIHGFTLLSAIDQSKFRGTLDPDGFTPLYDATLEAIESLYDYGKKLLDKQILANAIIFVITDGDDNASIKAKDRPDKIKEMLKKIQREEILESVRVICIGINDTDDYVKQRLDLFKTEAGIEYISAGDVTEAKLAKIAQFISQSVSSTSLALNSGGPSQPVDFTF